MLKPKFEFAIGDNKTSIEILPKEMLPIELLEHLHCTMYPLLQDFLYAPLDTHTLVSATTCVNSEVHRLILLGDLKKNPYTGRWRYKDADGWHEWGPAFRKREVSPPEIIAVDRTGLDAE